MAFKPHIALLLVLLFRQRQLRLLLGSALALALITWLSLLILSLPISTFLGLYLRNLTFYNDIYVYENHALEGSASLWNAYKVGLLYAQSAGLIAPVDFSFDGVFIHRSYTIYSALMGLFALGVVLQVCLVEKEFKRCVAMLLVFISIAVPSGSDYRMLYAWLALVPLILLKSERRFDRLTLILLALVMVPKKECFLFFAGQTESGYEDVSVQVLLNPLFLVSALVLLGYDGWAQFDVDWSKRRFSSLFRMTIVKRIQE